MPLQQSRLLGITVPRRGQLIRVLYSEIGRLLSHLLNLTTQALDVDALMPILWAFQERENTPYGLWTQSDVVMAGVMDSGRENGHINIDATAHWAPEAAARVSMSASSTWRRQNPRPYSKGAI